MNILEKFLNNKKAKQTATNSKKAPLNNQTDNNYNFESFKETVMQNTTLFDIDRSYIDNDKLTIQFSNTKISRNK